MAGINCYGDNIELKVIKPIYKTKIVKETSDGESLYVQKEVLVKELHIKAVFKKDGIVNNSEYITTKNTVAKNRTVVFDNYTREYYILAHSYDEVKRVLATVTQNKIGFNT